MGEKKEKTTKIVKQKEFKNPGCCEQDNNHFL